jgi:FkbM family methyltransferase
MGKAFNIFEYLLLKLPLSFPVPVWGFELCGCSWDRFLYLYLHRFSVMGKADLVLLRKFIKEGMTVVDVGANQGLYSLLFSALVSERGSVLSFEPDQHLFKCLQLNVSRNGAKNISLYPFALGSAGGTLPLHSSLINFGDNRLGSHPVFSRRSEIEVKVFDEQFPNLRVDFLKIDVQGWEYHVLEGMVQLFSNSPTLKVFFEFWPEGLTRAGSAPENLLKYFSERDFELQLVDKNGKTTGKTPDEILRESKPSAYTNILAIRGSR